MSSYCKACSEEIFGEDFRELANITKKEEWENGKAAVVICEGCGAIQIDPEGNCASFDCDKKGQKGHGEV